MRIITFIVVVGCIAAIVFGNIHWKQKISNVPTEGVIASEQTEQSKNINENKVDQKDAEIEIEPFVKSLPQEVADFIIDSSRNNEKIEIAIIGSEANTMGEKNWPTIFKQEIEEVYGDLFNISVYEIPNVTTIDVINESLHMDFMKETTDIVILEPFMLNDNGAVLLEQTLENIGMMIEDYKEVNSDVFFFIQPPHPIYNAIHYPREVEELKALVEHEGHYFIDHWENWPNYQTDEIKEYILPSNVAPTEKGHVVWAEHIVKLFIHNGEDE